jgi:hypothetical protein
MLNLKSFECIVHHTFKLEHTRIDKGIVKTCSSYIQMEINMSVRVVNLGLPPGRTLLKVKSKTYLSVLTMAFY